MAAHRSFTDYVRKRFDNDFWVAAESYLETNIHTLGLEQQFTVPVNMKSPM